MSFLFWGEGGKTYCYFPVCPSVCHKSWNPHLLHFEREFLKTLHACLLLCEDLENSILLQHFDQTNFWRSYFPFFYFEYSSKYEGGRRHMFFNQKQPLMLYDYSKWNCFNIKWQMEVIEKYSLFCILLSKYGNSLNKWILNQMIYHYYKLQKRNRPHSSYMYCYIIL